MQVSENWKKRLQAMPGLYSSQELDIQRVNKCAEIAIRCVDKDREKRPFIKDIVHELQKLEAEIKKLSQISDLPEDRTGQVWMPSPYYTLMFFQSSISIERPDLPNFSAL
jgi:hypothetical protein